MTPDLHGPSDTSPHRWWALALVCVTTLMLVLDVTVVIVALPDIQTSLHTNLSSLQWIIDAYTIALATLLLTAATLGDRLGRRRMFVLGTALFTLGSLACALAPSALALDAFRAVQGIGGAVLFGVGLPIIAATFPAGRGRNAAIAAFGASSGTALALGPLLGGLLIEAFGWRSIFFVNVPIGIVVLLAAARRLPESRDPSAGRPDWWGTATVSVAAFALVLALVRGHAEGFGSPLILGLSALAVVAFLAFVRVERTVAVPMLDLGLFRSRTFSANAGVAFTVQAVLVGALTYLSLYVQNTLGYGPVGAGLRIVPLTAMSFAVAVAAAFLLNRLPARPLVVAAAGFTAAGLLAMAHLHAGSTWTVLIPGMLLCGVGLGLASTVVNQVALAAVPPERSGMAGGAINAVKQVGVAAGVAGLGALFASRAAAGTVGQLTAGRPFPAGPARQIGAAVGQGAGDRVVPGVPVSVRPWVEHAARVGTTAGVDAVLVVGAVLALCAAVCALVVMRPARLPDDPWPQEPAVGEPADRSVSAAPAPARAVPAGWPSRGAPLGSRDGTEEAW